MSPQARPSRAELSPSLTTLISLSQSPYLFLLPPSPPPLPLFCLPSLTSPGMGTENFHAALRSHLGALPSLSGPKTPANAKFAALSPVPFASGFLVIKILQLMKCRFPFHPNQNVILDLSGISIVEHH